MARASTRRRQTRASELLCAAYLVERSKVSGFAERVAELQQENPELRILCTGPWPPYSFTSE
jgi:hypothetical protein